jgi:hypothetical protein
VFNATFLSAKISLQVFTKEAFSSFDASDNVYLLIGLPP